MLRKKLFFYYTTSIFSLLQKNFPEKQLQKFIDK